MRLVRLLFGCKVFCFSILIGVLSCWTAFDVDKFYAVNARWPREGDPIFASHFATWDAAHYLYLSEVGYQRHVPSCAFYPLWPLLVRWAAPLAGGSHLIAGLVLSNLFSLAAWVLLYERVRRRWGKSVASWALVFLISFPGSLFFQFHYTESLFFLLVMLLWWGLEERRWGLAWGGGAAAALDAGGGCVCGVADRVAGAAGGTAGVVCATRGVGRVAVGEAGEKRMVDGGRPRGRRSQKSEDGRKAGLDGGLPHRGRRRGTLI